MFTSSISHPYRCSLLLFSLGSSVLFFPPPSFSSFHLIEPPPLTICRVVLSNCGRMKSVCFDGTVDRGADDPAWSAPTVEPRPRLCGDETATENQSATRAASTSSYTEWVYATTYLLLFSLRSSLSFFLLPPTTRPFISLRPPPLTICRVVATNDWLKHRIYSWSIKAEDII